MKSKEKAKREKELWIKDLGDHIKRLRLSEGYTGVDFEFKLGMYKPNLTRMKKGRVNPS